jgi:hypothetical protein
VIAPLTKIVVRKILEFGTTPNAQSYGMHFAVTAYPEKSDVIGLRLALRMVSCLPQ